MMNPRVIGLLALLVLLFLFSASNIETTEVAFLTYKSPPMPLFLVVVLSFLAGFTVAALWSTLKGKGGKVRPSSPKAEGEKKEVAPPPQEKVEEGTAKAQTEDVVKDNDKEKDEERTSQQ